MFKKQVNSYIWGLRRGRLLYCPNFDMGDCLAWGDSFCSGSYFCCATYAGFFFSIPVRDILLQHIPGKLGTAQLLIWHIVLTLKPTQGCCTAECCQGCSWGLREQPRAGWAGEQGSAVHCLKRLDTCTRSAEKPAWFADRVVRKSRCPKNNPSWKKLSLPPMKLLCVQLPAMVFAVQGLSFAYVLTYPCVAVCNISTQLDLTHRRVVQLETIWGCFAWLACLCPPTSFRVLVEIPIRPRMSHLKTRQMTILSIGLMPWPAILTNFLITAKVVWRFLKYFCHLLWGGFWVTPLGR